MPFTNPTPRVAEICRRLEDRGYQLRVTDFDLGRHEGAGKTLAIACPVDTEVAWKRVAASGGQPYWSQLWPAAETLARFVASPLDIPQIQRRRVLDFACGLGATGVAASLRGGLVDFADISGDALLFARLNEELNRPFVQAKSGSEAAFPSRFRQFDWQGDRWDTKYDCILAADVLYDPDCWDSVSLFWHDQLAVGGRVFTCEPGRRVCESIESWFVDNDWQVTVRPFGPESSTRISSLTRANS